VEGKKMSLSKELLEELYNAQHLSMAEIAERLDCSPNKVAYWMIKYEIPRRDISEAIYEKRNPGGDPFQIQESLSDDERDLFQLVVGLYIGEGNKRRGDEVSISNSDSRVIRAFIRFVCDICGVNRDELFLSLNVYDDVETEDVLSFWEEVTGLHRSQFHKPVVRSKRGGTYALKSKFGTVKVGVYNTKLHSIIIDWCNEALKY
jgi:hypothetical protein